MRKRFVIIFLAIVLLAGLGVAIVRADRSEPPTTPTVSKSPAPKPSPKPPVFDKTRYSLSDPVSPWVVVNKKRPLNPQSYAPTDLRVPNVALKGTTASSNMRLRDPAARAVETMFAAANNEGIALRVSSAYRTYDYQVQVYNGYVRTEGQTAADAESARPGYSEHQTGLAVDISDTTGRCDLEQCFGDTAAGKWAADNAHKYGFIIRYPKDYTAVTGYLYEPWHLRYVGTELATEMRDKNIPTLEQYFELGSAPTY